MHNTIKSRNLFKSLSVRILYYNVYNIIRVIFGESCEMKIRTFYTANAFFRMEKVVVQGARVNKSGDDNDADSCRMDKSMDVFSENLSLHDEIRDFVDFTVRGIAIKRELNVFYFSLQTPKLIRASRADMDYVVYTNVAMLSQENKFLGMLIMTNFLNNGPIIKCDFVVKCFNHNDRFARISCQCQTSQRVTKRSYCSEP